MSPPPLLALGVLAARHRLGAGDRRDELAALRVTGVRPRVLRRACAGNGSRSLGLPLVVGLAVGSGLRP